MKPDSMKLDTLPWYKQGWPWALIAIPLLTVIAGVTTFMIAANDPHSMVVDDYFKRGLAINQSLERERYARSLKLGGSIATDPEANLLLVEMQNLAHPHSRLKISFFHPTKENLDLEMPLEYLTGNTYIAPLPQFADTFWHVNIEDDKRDWLIKFRWHATQDPRINF